MREPFNAAIWLVERHVAEGRGGSVALRTADASVTYAELADRIGAFGAGLRRLGVRPEERVVLVMLDSVEMVVAFLGAVRIGAIATPVNPLLPSRDVAAIVNEAGGRYVLVSQARAEAVGDLAPSCPGLVSQITTGTPAWEDVAGGGGDGTPASTTADSPGFWLCTSGTTGTPKLAMHRHADLRTPAETYAASVLRTRPGDVCYSVGPMFHAYGLGNSVTFPFAVGASAVLEPIRPPTPALVAANLARHRPALFFCIPTFYAALAASDLPAGAFASVRRAVSAAEALPAETWRRFHERFGVEILDGIGSTEMTHIFVSNHPGAVRPGTSGTPVDGYDVRLVDDAGADVGPDEPGQLLVRGDSAATGYWRDTANTRRTFLGEWVRTGDTYVRSRDGYLTHLGRSDEMLRVGGEWVSPVEVEGVLMQHPGVLEAAVVGHRGADGVQRPVAFVTLRPEAAPDAVDGIGAFCREQLAGYKRPRRIEVLAALPKTASGKVRRVELAERLRAEG